MTLRVGYRIDLFNKRVFIEPSVASTYWPVNTHLPASIAAEEAKYPNYSLFEPGLDVGINL